MNILEEFWYGNIEPAEEDLSHTNYKMRQKQPDFHGTCADCGVHSGNHSIKSYGCPHMGTAV